MKIFPGLKLTEYTAEGKTAEDHGKITFKSGCLVILPFKVKSVLMSGGVKFLFCVGLLQINIVKEINEEVNSCCPHFKYTAMGLSSLESGLAKTLRQLQA